MGLLLASASPRRQELLRLITKDFTVLPAAVEESLPPALSAEEAAQCLARKKAAAVSAQHPKDLVLGSDTTVLLGDQILGKPGTPERAAEMLRLLSGKTHRVITGVALARGGVLRSFQSETAVTFYPLSEEEIAAYVATGEPLDKAGAYAVQGRASAFVRSIHGSPTNVIGLPLETVARMLREAGWKLMG